jgi:predicted RNase H-like HicB family nuclease
MKLLVIVEEAATGYSAYSPDLPGCIATGSSHGDVEQRMREAIELHLEGLRADGEDPPQSRAYATIVEVAT